MSDEEEGDREDPPMQKVTNLYDRSPGRKSKLTPELLDRLVQLVANGNYIETACGACGITSASYYKWLRKGEEFYAMFHNAYGHDAEVDEEILIAMVKEDIITEHQAMCVRFVEALNKASSESEAYAVLTVRKAFGDDWKAAMTFLERRFPQRWRRRTGIEVETGGVDTEATARQRQVLENPDAVALQHEALRMIAEESVDSTAEDL